MHLLFVDESGQIDHGGLFALGGVAVRDREWPALRRGWQDTLGAHGWPLDREVKWHLIRTGGVPPALGDALFAMLAAAPVTAYVTLLDQRAGAWRIPSCSPRRRTRTRPGSCSWPSASTGSWRPRTTSA